MDTKSGMAIVNSDEQFKDVVEQAAKRGLRLACQSNTGLKPGWWRLTFLSESAFRKDGDAPLPRAGGQL